MSDIASYSIDKSELEHIDKICVICWGLVGDVFVRISTIEALKTRFPKSYILAVVDPAGQRALQNHPAIDEIFIYSRNKRPLLKYIFRTIKNILYLRKCKFDLSVNLYSGGSSPRIVRMINARIRLGFDHTEALRKSNNLLVKHPDLSKQWNRAFGSVLQPLGVSSADVRAGTSFYCSAEAEQYAMDFLGETGRNYIAINLGAGKDIKRWPIEKYVELAGIISKKYKLIPLVLSNPGMTELADQFADQYSAVGEYVKAPLVYMDKDAALMKRCRFVVTGDTSIMHLAFALKIPTLVLFTSTRPEPVLPEDCPYRYCFIPGTTEVDEFGQPLGIFDIPVSMAVAEFEKLVQDVRNNDQ